MLHILKRKEKKIQRNVNGLALGITFAVILMVLLMALISVCSWLNYKDLNTYNVITVTKTYSEHTKIALVNDESYDTDNNVTDTDNNVTISKSFNDGIEMTIIHSFRCKEYEQKGNNLNFLEITYEQSIFGKTKEVYCESTISLNDETSYKVEEVKSDVSYSQYVKHLWLRDANALYKKMCE